MYLKTIRLILLMLAHSTLVAVRPVTAISAAGARLHSAAEEQDDLTACINENYVPKLLSWQDSFVDCVPSLKVLGTWWSPRARSIPVTIITHASIDRLPQLLAQCRSWAGPISVVLYTNIILSPTTASAALPNLSHIPALRRSTVESAKFADSVARDPSCLCQLDIMLVVEAFLEPHTSVLYPYNVLRNLARLQASWAGQEVIAVGRCRAQAVSSDAVVSKVALTWGDVWSRRVSPVTVNSLLPAFISGVTPSIARERGGSPGSASFWHGCGGTPPRLSAWCVRRTETSPMPPTSRCTLDFPSPA